MKRYLTIVAIAAASGMFAAGAVQSLFSAYAVQNELVPPTTGIYTGPQFSQKIGDAFRSLASCQKGGVAPANVGGATVDGLCWIDDSVSPWVLKRYVNGGWAIEGAFDPSTSTYAGLIGGGLGSVASATTTDLNLVPQANVTITGATTIGGFGSASPAGVVKFIRFAGVLTLTNSSSLTIPCGYDLLTAAKDRAIVTHLGSGNWEVTQYTRDSGIPIDCSAVGKFDFASTGAVPALHVLGDGSPLTRTSYPAYLAKVTIAQNGTRTSGNATITGIANTSRMGAGMPVESTGVNAGCTIASLVANTSITLNSSSCVTASGTSTVTVFLTGYGTGGTSSTVGVRDCTGRSLAGREIAPNRLTASYFGGNSTALGATGGSEFTTMVQTNLPNVALGVTGSLSVTSTPTNILTGTLQSPFLTTTTPSGQYTLITVGTGGASSITSTGSLASGLTASMNGGVTQASLANVPPMLIADCVVRVTP